MYRIGDILPVSVGKLVFAGMTAENITGEPVMDSVDDLIESGVPVKVKVSNLGHKITANCRENTTEVLLTQGALVLGFNVLKEKFEHHRYNRPVSFLGLFSIKPF